MGQRAEAVLPVTARYFDFVPHHVGADALIGPYKAHREKAHFLFCFCIAKTSPSSEGDV